MHWCAAAKPAEPLPHKRTAPVRMRRVAPKRRVLCYHRVEPAHESPRRQTLLHVSTQSHKHKAATQAVIDITGARVQRLEVLVAVMLARERLSPADAAADGCTELAAALATLPSRPLEMIAEAVAALGWADA